MKYSISLYCPDAHIKYDLHTLDRTGVGGGITTRVRIAHALASIGIQVTLYVNCPRERKLKGVSYLEYQKANEINDDIFIVSSSGGNMDLSAIAQMQIHSRLKILMIHGVTLPKNINPDFFDFIYVPSSFILKSVQKSWHLDPSRFFTSPRGMQESFFNSRGQKNSDHFKIAYFCHPMKGLKFAAEILAKLHETDKRFSLHVFGGYRLWGGAEQPIAKQPGLVYHGLVGQKRLARQLEHMCFCLNIQQIDEAYGIVINEAMRAGCVVLASPVGAFPEIIQHGVNGFLIDGDPNTEETQLRAVSLIRELVAKPEIREPISQNARNTPVDWSVIAKSWVGHWDWVLNSVDVHMLALLGKCSECGGELLLLADGLHCTNCGNFTSKPPK